LDDRVLIVEYDIVKTTISADDEKKAPIIRKDSNTAVKGKTLKVQQKS
jgi:hypothetical protein